MFPTPLLRPLLLGNRVVLQPRGGAEWWNTLIEGGMGVGNGNKLLTNQ